jgi:hypothetical protein
MSLRLIYLHMLDEYARHLGYAVRQVRPRCGGTRFFMI